MLNSDLTDIVKIATSPMLLGADKELVEYNIDIPEGYKPIYYFPQLCWTNSHNGVASFCDISGEHVRVLTTALDVNFYMHALCIRV